MKAVECSELVLGLVTTVGTDTHGVIECLKDQLKKFKFTTKEISVSKDILKEFDISDAERTEYERIKTYMDLGDRVRQETGDNAILMRGVAAHIFKEVRGGESDPKPQKNTAYIIKSLKHPEEVACLRQIYGDGFYAIGVTSTKEERIAYLTEQKELTEEQALELVSRDADDGQPFGQHTQDAFQRADYFLSVTDSQAEMKNNVTRLVELLFGNPYLTPNFNEYAMFMAYASSLRSADLSRQIGAVVTINDEILASGVNDCARPGGGLYWPEAGKSGKWEDAPGGRDYMLECDSNKVEQSRIIDRIISELDLEPSEEIKKKIKKAGVGSLTEYGRVVHAEMEALSMCARNMVSTRGTTMYVTTFPCHNCAKHIIACGVDTVYYIEPYPKSKALEFYKEQITTKKDGSNRVKFLPFSGVGPRRFTDLFSMDSHRWQKRERKDDTGKVIEWDRKKAKLRTPMPINIYLDNEKMEYSTFWESIEIIKQRKDE